MFVKTSHPPGDNGWCWALGVICPWCCWHWHRAPGHLTIVSRDAITGILFTSGGSKYRNMRRVVPNNKLTERNLIVASEGLFIHIQKILLWEITLYDSWIKHFMGKVLLKARSGSISMNSRYPDGRWQRKPLGLFEMKGICWMRWGCLELSHY